MVGSDGARRPESLDGSVIGHSACLRVSRPAFARRAAPWTTGRRIVEEQAAARARIECALGEGAVRGPIDRLFRVPSLDLPIHRCPGDRVRPTEALHEAEMDVAQLLMADAPCCAARVALTYRV